ncbi:hypothetical protein QLX08_007308 [Tetragonisca angustula]|uniref:Uncharacterized protein n=1 Tax=Tetragonisca angustula TaxID=166442 RepID=A0AAW0ZPU6_9HYME
MVDVGSSRYRVIDDQPIYVFNDKLLKVIKFDLQVRNNRGNASWRVSVSARIRRRCAKRKQIDRGRAKRALESTSPSTGTSQKSWS